MTKEQIERTEAGREMDALIAIKVLNRDPVLTYKYGNEKNGTHSIIPNYSTDIAAAWQVVEKINEKKNIRIEIDKEVMSVEIDTFYDSAEITATANTVTLAICRASLIYVMHQEDSDPGADI